MTGKKKKTSKTDAIRQALRGLGPDAARTEIEAFIKEKFGLTMSADQIYNIKSALKREGHSAPSNRAMAGPATSKSAAPKEVAAGHQVQRSAAQMQRQPHTVRDNGAVGGLSVPDIGVVKELVGRVGPRELKGLIDVLTA